MSKKAGEQQKFFIGWCVGCGRKTAVQNISGNTFSCSDLTCPANRRTDGMALSSEQIDSFELNRLGAVARR